MAIFGIDPGLTGALAHWSGTGRSVIAMPVMGAGTKKAGARILDEMAIRFWLDRHRTSPQCCAFIERVSAFPKMGVVSAFTFGTGFGQLRGILVGLGIRYLTVGPKEWQKTILSGTASKDTKAASLVVAKRLYPELAQQIGKHHGMADALNICEYGRRQLAMRDSGQSC